MTCMLSLSILKINLSQDGDTEMALVDPVSDNEMNATGLLLSWAILTCRSGVGLYSAVPQ